MKKADLIYKKIENFLIINGCEAWQYLSQFFTGIQNGGRNQTTLF